VFGERHCLITTISGESLLTFPAWGAGNVSPFSISSHFYAVSLNSSLNTITINSNNKIITIIFATKKGPSMSTQ
jgi:hypothetical protein